MDGARFDALTRSLAGGASRRRFVGALLGLGAGTVRIRGTGAVTCPPGQVSRKRVGCVCQLTGRPPVGGVCPCPMGAEDTGDGQGCLPPCGRLPDGTQCAPGKVCSYGACLGNGVCAPGKEGTFGCGTCQVGDATNSFCHRTPEGGLTCLGNVFCADAQSCTASSECPAGFACFTAGSCGGVCRPICGEEI